MEAPTASSGYDLGCVGPKARRSRAENQILDRERSRMSPTATSKPMWVKRGWWKGRGAGGFDRISGFSICN